MTGPRVNGRFRPEQVRDITARAIAWGWTRLGTPGGPEQGFPFVAEALASGGVQLAVRSAQELISRCRMTLRQDIPAEGALVLYAYAPEAPDGTPREEGFCALSLGCGDVLYAWNVVREDHYLILPRLYPLRGKARPRSLGWVSMEQVLLSLTCRERPGREAS